MGLFDKKTCALCGASVGLLGGMLGENLADGAYMCGDCRKKCIPDNTLDFNALTVDAAKAVGGVIGSLLGDDDDNGEASDAKDK